MGTHVLTVAVVEDDRDIADLLRMRLELEGVHVAFVEASAEGACARDWDGVDAAVVDLRLAGKGSGLDVLAWLGDNHPDVRRVVASATLPFVGDVLDGLAEFVLAKPFDSHGLLAALRGDADA